LAPIVEDAVETIDIEHESEAEANPSSGADAGDTSKT
jgi:hypothetical protein